jgi:integrase
MYTKCVQTARKVVIMHGAYFLYKRQLKQGTVWYFKTYSSDGTLTTGKTTGCKAKTAARAYCDDLLKHGQLYGGSSQQFGVYAAKWFDDGSPWFSDKMEEGTTEHPALSLSTIKQYRQHLEKHIMPYFADYKLHDIKPSDIKHFRTHLIQDKSMSRKTVNNVVAVLRIITDYALADNIMMFDPFRGIRPMKGDDKKRDAFTLEEAENIFRAKWRSDVSRIANLTAALTGMRISEILAINKKNLHEDFIDVTEQMYQGRICPTKTKEQRKIPIPRTLYEFLKPLCNLNDKHFAFGFTTEMTVLRHLNEVLALNGMAEEKKKRLLCVHSWRHFFNTFLLSENVPPVKVAAVIGHSSGSGSMQERYTNWSPDMFPEVYEAQEKLIKLLQL